MEGVYMVYPEAISNETFTCGTWETRSLFNSSLRDVCTFSRGVAISSEVISKNDSPTITLLPLVLFDPIVTSPWIQEVTSLKKLG